MAERMHHESAKALSVIKMLVHMRAHVATLLVHLAVLRIQLHSNQVMLLTSSLFDAYLPNALIQQTLHALSTKWKASKAGFTPNFVLRGCRNAQQRLNVERQHMQAFSLFSFSCSASCALQLQPYMFTATGPIMATWDQRILSSAENTSHR